MSYTNVGLTISENALNVFSAVTSIPTRLKNFFKLKATLGAFKCNDNSDPQFIRYFFNPTKENPTYPSKVDQSRSSAFTIDSDFLCPNFCACPEIGSCYNRSSINDHVYVKFVPYCMDFSMYSTTYTNTKNGIDNYLGFFQPPCYMYMVIYDQGLDGAQLNEISTNSPFNSPDPNKVALIAGSYYAIINSVSCSGCEALQNVKCYADASGNFNFKRTINKKHF